MGVVWVRIRRARRVDRTRAVAQCRPRGEMRESDEVRTIRAGVALMAMALSGCAAAVVTGGAIVADEVVEQVQGGGDGLF